MYRLVIADDEFYIREGLCKLDWAAMGIEVAAACKNGAEAAKYIYENPVDILLTDISMPIVSGLELIQDVGRRFPAIKTVALTAYDDFEYIRTCLRCGTVDYVLKPFTEEALKKTFAAVTDILDKEKAEQKRVAELERVNRMKTLALRREWTTSLFRENMSDERMEEISVYCELFLDSPWYFLCAVRPDDMDSLPDADRELAAFSFQNAMEDFCGDGAACFAIGENAACYYLRGFDVPPSEEEQRQLAQTIRCRLYKLRGVFRCPLS
ncbi:MAG: response regulator, partial [Oscillospiraceae bacterium]|nr:response regulator [Oscillospiraceae bacterium]